MNRSTHCPRWFGYFSTLCLVSLLFTWPSIAFATEIITHTYDTRGRVIKVERTGSVNNDVKAEYTLDKAGNRTNVTVTGLPN